MYMYKPKTKTQQVKDTISGEEWVIKAKVVVNATGVFADAIRKMDDPNAVELIEPAAGECLYMYMLYMCVCDHRDVGWIDQSTRLIPSPYTK
jgi:glycerol-3-phosphate dehydrogenase